MQVSLVDDNGAQVRTIPLTRYGTQLANYMSHNSKSITAAALNSDEWSITTVLNNGQTIRVRDYGEGLRYALEETYRVTQAYVNRGLRNDN